MTTATKEWPIDIERWEIGRQEYHEHFAISQSMLKSYRQNPELFAEVYVRKTRQPKPPSPSMQFGTAVENYVLHGELDAVQIPAEALNKDGHRKGSAWTAWQEQAKQQHPGKQLLTPREWEDGVGGILAAAEKLELNPVAVKLLLLDDLHLENGRYHMSLRWTESSHDLQCKCQLDCVNYKHKVIVDLKTCADVTPDGFRRAVESFGYFCQAYWYQKAWEMLTGERWPVVFVCVANSEPHNVEVYSLDEEWYRLGQQWVGDTMDRLYESMNNDEWHSPTWGKVISLECRDWTWKKMEGWSDDSYER